MEKEKNFTKIIGKVLVIIGVFCIILGYVINFQKSNTARNKKSKIKYPIKIDAHFYENEFDDETGTHDLFTEEELLSSMGIIKIEKNGKYGFIDKEGKKITDIIYDDASLFSENLVAVKKGEKWGYIDKTGKVVIDFKYDEAYDFNEGLALVKIQNKKSNTPENYMIEGVDTNNYYFINKKGKVIIEVNANSHKKFQEGLASIEKDGKCVFVNKKGETVIELEEKLCSVKINSFSEDLAFVETEKLAGFIDKTGKLIIPIEPGTYDYVSDFKEGLARVKKDNKYGYIDKTGKVVIDLKYKSAEDFSEGFAAVSSNGFDTIYIDQEGKEVLSFNNGEGKNFSEGLASISKYGRNNYINKKGKTIIKSTDSYTKGIIFNDASSFKDGISLVLLEELHKDKNIVYHDYKYAYIDKTGKILLEEKNIRATQKLQNK